MTPKNQQRTPQKLQLKDFQEFHKTGLKREVLRIETLKIGFKA
jgi:hypothetical protein